MADEKKVDTTIRGQMNSLSKEAREFSNDMSKRLHDEVKLKEVIDDLFINPNKLDEKDKQHNSTVDTSGIDKTKLKIEVLNGTSSNTKLEKVVAQLESAGYSINKTGNTTETQSSTIITRGEVPDLVQEEIKQILGTQTVSNGGNAAINITIIIGKDYE